MGLQISGQRKLTVAHSSSAHGHSAPGVELNSELLAKPEQNFGDLSGLHSFISDANHRRFCIERIRQQGMKVSIQRRHNPIIGRCPLKNESVVGVCETNVSRVDRIVTCREETRPRGTR